MKKKGKIRKFNCSLHPILSLYISLQDKCPSLIQFYIVRTIKLTEIIKVEWQVNQILFFASLLHLPSTSLHDLLSPYISLLSINFSQFLSSSYLILAFLLALGLCCCLFPYVSLISSQNLTFILHNSPILPTILFLNFFFFLDPFLSSLPLPCWWLTFYSPLFTRAVPSTQLFSSCLVAAASHHEKTA